MRWPLTFFVDSLQPNVAGRANGPVIRILKSYQNDEGIYQHELTHVKQWFFTFGLHSILYLFWNKYKLWSEIVAYRKQLNYYPDDRSALFATFISTNYGLNISHKEALPLLIKN